MFQPLHQDLHRLYGHQAEYVAIASLFIFSDAADTQICKHFETV